MNPFVGEIVLFSFNFAPKGFALCNGQTLAINQNQALFSLLGTTYGGNGQTTFALPNLQGCTPMHESGSYPIGETLGALSATLAVTNIPTHSHSFSVSPNFPTSSTPGAASSLGQGPPQGSGPNLAPANLYSSSVPSPASVLSYTSLSSSAGGGQPFSIQQPFLTLNFTIALTGIFPSRN